MAKATLVLNARRRQLARTWLTGERLYYLQFGGRLLRPSFDRRPKSLTPATQIGYSRREICGDSHCDAAWSAHELQEQAGGPKAKGTRSKESRVGLEESVRTHLLPALVKQGFRTVPQARPESVDRKYAGSHPGWGKLIRARETIIDQVEIQFSSYGRAAFRINACAVPKDGMMTAGGHKTAEECIALGVHNLETHAHPWLRPALRALGLEPLGEWFSVWHWPFRSATQTDYEKLALFVVGILPELELAPREGTPGPHIDG